MADKKKIEVKVKTEPEPVEIDDDQEEAIQSESAGHSIKANIHTVYHVMDSLGSKKKRPPPTGPTQAYQNSKK
jgi:hypothetical protein